MDAKQEREWARLEAAVDAFAVEMKARLYQKMQEGYSGWDDPAQASGIASTAMSDANLVSLLEDRGLTEQYAPLELRKCVDAANRLTMVWYIRAEQARTRI